MTSEIKWTTTTEVVNKVVSHWRMVVLGTNIAGRPPTPTDFINAIESLSKEERSVILIWFNRPSSISDMMEDNVQLTKSIKVLEGDIDALNAEVARLKAILQDVNRVEEQRKRLPNFGKCAGVGYGDRCGWSTRCAPGECKLLATPEQSR